MSEERRAVIEAALRRTTTAEDWVAGMAAGIERAVVEWERSREPTDAEINRLRRLYPWKDVLALCDALEAALRAARDLRQGENADE